MKKIKKLFNPLILLVLLVAIAFNTVSIKAIFAKESNGVVAETIVQMEQTETTYNIKNFDNTIVEEYEKHKEIKDNVENNISTFANSNTETEEELTNDDVINYFILQMVYEDVAYAISDQGFEIFESTALDLENSLQYFGLTYTENSIVENNYLMAGFVRIVNDDSVLDTNIKLVSFNNGEDDGYKYLITDFNIEKNNSHFVYYDKYVKYWWVNERTIKYTINDNQEENYDLSLGKLFSYDELEYIYESNFTYTSQEVVSMFNYLDYDKLQETIDKINEEQKANGYYVQEITITYIDLDLIQEWERGQDKTTFFGYDLEQLNAAFGADTTLQFDADGGVKKGELIETTNWLKVGLMFLAGCAAMLIGAALAPLTGGCSFGASLLCIMKMTAVAVVSDLLTKTLISTISGVISGKGFFDSLTGAIKSTFTIENIAQTFMTSAIMSAVMVGSGLVKACFTEDTPVLTENGYKAINEINIGDKVLSYSELTGMIVAKEVTDILVNESDDVCTIALSSGDVITSTSLHPWYVQNKGWVPAYALTETDNLLTQTGENVKILGVQRQKLDEPINVYNITVGDENTDEYHNYFVGNDNVLVHNDCATDVKSTNNNKQPTDKQIKYQRKKAVDKAWKKEYDLIKNKQPSKYNWTPAQRKEILLNGRVKGYDGCHLIDVQKCKEMGRFDLIGNPDNIVFLKRFGQNSHFYIHGNNWRNLTDLNKVKEILPWITENLTKLGL